MKFIKWLYAQVNEMFAWFFTLFFAPFSLMKDKWTGKTSNKPILLIHGYCNYSSVWMFHIMHFLSADLGPVYTVDLGYPFDSIENYAQKVRAKVEKILAETGSDEVSIVGHSMGGLVASYYALNVAPDNQVKKVITLGTPFSGTKLAIFAMGKCGKQMRRGSEFVRNLQVQMQEAHNVGFYHVAAENDQIVVPYTSAIVKNSGENLIFDAMGHVGLLFSRKVNRELIQWLKI